MKDSEELLRRIVDESHIPPEKRKRAVQRKLRSRFEDSILAAREAGLPDDHIRQLVLASFGDPAQVAQGFAWV